MRKLFMVASIFIASVLLVTGCFKKDSNVDGALTDIMDRMYTSIAEENLPMALKTTELTEDNIAYFIGTSDIAWKEAVVSESQTGSIAHSVVLIRMKEGVTDQQIVDAKQKIKENADPRKWICVEAENVFVESKGDLIILIMSDEKATTIRDNFLNL